MVLKILDQMKELRIFFQESGHLLSHTQETPYTFWVFDLGQNPIWW